MTRYSAFSRTPNPGSDYEFYVAGFEVLNARTHSSYLIAAAHGYECGPNPLAEYWSLVRDNIRSDVTKRLAEAGISQAQIETNSELLKMVDELVVADRSCTALQDVWGLSAHLGSPYVVPPHCQVLSAAADFAGGTRSAIAILNRNARFGGLTKDHLRRGKMAFARHLTAWFRATHLPPGKANWMLLNVLIVRAAWFGALVEMRLAASQHPHFKKLRGKDLAQAIDERRGFARTVLECIQRADRKNGVEYRTFHALSGLDLALPRRDASPDLAGAI